MKPISEYQTPICDKHSFSLDGEGVQYRKDGDYIESPYARILERKCAALRDALSWTLNNLSEDAEVVFPTCCESARAILDATKGVE